MEPAENGRYRALSRLASELHQAGYETASVGMLSDACDSNGWWTLWAARIEDSSWPAHHGNDPVHGPFTGTTRIRNCTIWAPIFVGEIPKPLKLAMAYAGEPLCDTGFHSATPWYDASVFADPLYDDPKPRDFPAEARAAPHFCGNGLLYHEKVEPSRYNPQNLLINSGMCSSPAPMLERSNSRKRTKTDLELAVDIEPVGNATRNDTSIEVTTARVEVAEIKRWRIVYHNFVHVVCVHINQESFPSFMFQRREDFEED